MVDRVYVAKKPGLAPEETSLLADCRAFLGLTGLERIRIWNRYDAENIDAALFDYARRTVFSEPQLDEVSDRPAFDGAAAVFAVEPLPGQFDQRADSAAQCIQMLSRGERPLIHSAKVYVLYGTLSVENVEAVKRYVINRVESREASLELPETLTVRHEQPDTVETETGFIALEEAGLSALLERLGLAMDLEDLKLLQSYFRDEEHRDPTITELRVVDTYWSDHCRHTTFSTHIDRVDIRDDAVQAAYEHYLALREEVYGPEAAKKRPQTLMDIATLGAKVLKKRGLLPELDESEEINACSIHVPAVVDGEEQDWLLMFKNETHNHPTEIEPFGGAATCIGGCIRDPLSGRAYVHQAMRVTGGGDPRKPLVDTLAGKLPQRKLAQTAAAGYSSYGNQIGLATGHVAEIYHEGYVAKRLECGAVVAAVLTENVVRERPQPGDVVILLGGRTGRDGIGGATGSSKSHDLNSLAAMASEVQKGNAPEERKLQRLFRRGDVTRMIKRCNDFGAGGVSVAIGELTEGVSIDLDAVRRKYDGLDGTEFAISESQERMAVVVSPEDAERFIAAAGEENLEAYRVAVITESPRMVMRWKGQTIADISRAFLDTNGAAKHTAVSVAAADRAALGKTGLKNLREVAASLKSASRRGLVERFDSTVGAGSVTVPFGGRTQTTPAQSMAALLPVLPGQKTEQASVMAYGFDADQMTVDPFVGAYHSVIVSAAKLVAAGADYRKAYLTFQEFFEKLRDEPLRWGKPFAALLGALEAQMDLGAAAIGGKDSMSGSFMDRDVPPTLISFAIAPVQSGEVLTPEFKSAGDPVYLFLCDGTAADQRAVWERFHALCCAGKVRAAWAVENSMAEGVMKMSFGNRVGFRSEGAGEIWYSDALPGAIIAELSEPLPQGTALRLGVTTADGAVTLGEDTASIDELLALNEGVLESVYPTRTADSGPVETLTYRTTERKAPAVAVARPRVLIPVFPGTNCEYDTQRAFLEAGAAAETFVLRNLTAADVAESVEQFAMRLKAAQIVALPGGFSGGDEPDGSAKFITAFFRNPAVREQVTELLERRDGLMLGICNGFQALIKLGLVPFGRIVDTDASCPTLTYNHRPPPVQNRSDAGVLQQVTVAGGHGGGRGLRGAGLPRGGTLPCLRGRGAPPCGQRPDRNAVCGPCGCTHYGHGLCAQRLRLRGGGYYLPGWAGPRQNGPQRAYRQKSLSQHS